MSERVIAQVTAWPTSDDDPIQIVECNPDPDAPSVDEMCRVIDGLREVIETAISSGDWVVDGACDPEIILQAAYEVLRELEYQKDDEFAEPA